MQKKILRLQIKNHIKYFPKLLSFDCHTPKQEPRNAVNSAFLGSTYVTTTRARTRDNVARTRAGAQ